MAQDELGTRVDVPGAGQARGRARRTGLDTGHPMLVIAQELPDWASVIAANLVVDGILTTFVASARDSSIEPLAQRARKILQEEGAHKVHAEAWARRIARRAPISSCWCVGSTRCGRRRRGGRVPTRTLGTARRSPPGWSARARLRSATACATGSPAGRRRVAREPTDWSDWDRSTADNLPVLRVGGRRARLALGGQIITCQMRCRTCDTYFEAIREAFGESGSSRMPAANEPKRNSPWTTSSADDR